MKVNYAVYKRIGIPFPTVGQLLQMTANDHETWRMYADGLTIGLNQVEKEKTTAKVQQYKPRNITELAAFVAAVRPSFQSMMPTFLARKKFTYDIPTFDRLIQTPQMPSSFILYQEQVMKALQYGGFSAPESYSSIKAIAKKHPEKVLPLKERFLQGFSQRVLEDEHCSEERAMELSEQVWQIIADATGYGFNSSHAVCVALDSLYGAYAKAHHPLAFYTTILQIYGEKGDKERIARIKNEMTRGFGIRIAPCHFREDNRDYYIDKKNNTVSDTLSSIKYMSKKIAED